MLVALRVLRELQSCLLLALTSDYYIHCTVCPPHPRKQANSRQFMIADMLSSTCCGHLCTYLWPILALSVLCEV